MEFRGGHSLSHGLSRADALVHDRIRGVVVHKGAELQGHTTLQGTEVSLHSRRERESKNTCQTLDAPGLLHARSKDRLAHDIRDRVRAGHIDYLSPVHKRQGLRAVEIESLLGGIVDQNNILLSQ